MAKLFDKTLLWLAMTAVAANGQLFAQEVGEAALVETYQETDVLAEPVFSVEQVEQMVAPIALYPDSLLAQVLMASTYPMEVAQAHQWLENNRGLDGEALDDAVAAQPWDPSVKTLVFFPSVLERLAGDLAWTQDLGDAFLAQEVDVMGSVQRLRRQAQEAGNLASNEQQVVRTQGSTIVVEPADPATVYVPTYNPTTVYGSSWAPATTYYPTTYGYSSSFPTWVVFGAGVLVGAVLTAAIDWADDDDYYVVYPRYRRHRHNHIHYVYYNYWDRDWDGPRYGRPAWRSYRPVYLSRGDVYIDNSRTVNVTKPFVKRQWEHNPVHRHSVSYRDPQVTRKFLGTDATRRIDPAAPARLDRDGTRPLDRDALRRLDRSQPPALPADRATREALQGDERQRRERILQGQPDSTPFGKGPGSPEDAARRRFQERAMEQNQFGKGGEAPKLGRPGDRDGDFGSRVREPGRDARALGRTPSEASQPPGTDWARRRDAEKAASGGELRDLQRGGVEPQRPDARQFQQRAQPREAPAALEPPQIQRQPEARQFQPRAQPREMPKTAEPPQIQRQPEARQFQPRAQPREMPKAAEPPQIQRQPEARQFQPRAQPREMPRPAEPRQIQRQPEVRQLQQRPQPQPIQQRAEPRPAPQRAEVRKMERQAPPAAKRTPEGNGRQTAQQRSGAQNGKQRAGQGEEENPFRR